VQLWLARKTGAVLCAGLGVWRRQRHLRCHNQQL